MEFPDAPDTKTGWPWGASDSSDASGTEPDTCSHPRITVVTPSFNQGRFLEETIRSVLLQGYPNLEYIVMDGGSTDESMEILRRYEPFLSYLHIGPDGGQSAAIASGFEHATGEILAWLNSDDTYLPGTLARVGHFFATHLKHVLVNGDVELIDEGSQPYGMLRARPTQLFLTKNTGGHGWWQPGTFWRQQTYVACGGLDRRLRFCMDRELFIRICSAGKSGCIRGKPLAAFRTHQEQKSQTIKDVFLREHELLLARYGHPQWLWLRPLLGRVWRLWEIGDQLVGCFSRPAD